MLIRLFILTFLLLLAKSGPAFAQATDREFLILYTGNTLGELKPCGCAREEDQGGIERRMGFLKAARQSGPESILIDTGDSFKEASRQGILKARFLISAMERMNYDAVALGEKDLLYGPAFLASFPAIPWVASNLKIEQVPSLPPYRMRTLGSGVRVALLALSHPGFYYTGPTSGLSAGDPDAALSALAAKIRAAENPDLIVLMTHMPRESAMKYLDSEGIDAIVNGHIESETDVIDMEPVVRDGKIFVQSGPRGQKIGEIRVRLDAAKRKTYTHRMVKLDSKIPFDPGMTSLYDDYNTKVEEIFFETLKARKGDGLKKVYATDAACKTCHAAEHDAWTHSRHGRAYDTLKKVNKAFDPECLACHTVGFNQPGGFVSENDTPDLANVQCEMCHGPAREHAENPKPGWSSGAAQACNRCHVKNHSPKFDFSQYWPRIRHGSK